jgi:hypothetical protein
MPKRPFVSLFIATTFIVLSVSGILLFTVKASGLLIFLHVFFGGLFLSGALLHFASNWISLKKYLRRKWVVPISILLLLGLFGFEVFPVDFLANSYARFKSKQPQTFDSNIFVEYPLHSNSNLTLEVRAGQHFWYPQIVVWIENNEGEYLETLFTTYSTAKGVFYGGRTKENFKDLDSELNTKENIIKVDALPYWSHKRGIETAGGYFSPNGDNQLPDGITGATPGNSFNLRTKYPELTTKFKILLEANVAFDENEFFSEFDFPDDSLYHSGAGLLGQPSIIYEAVIEISSENKYYLMNYKGHTFPSGNSGEIIQDKAGLTTALEIIDLALIKVN